MKLLFKDEVRWLLNTTTLLLSQSGHADLLQENHDPFSRTVKLSYGSSDSSIDCTMRLDTGCEEHNLITREVVQKLGLSNIMTINREVIRKCLDGEYVTFLRYDGPSLEGRTASQRLQYGIPCRRWRVASVGGDPRWENNS